MIPKIKFGDTDMLKHESKMETVQKPPKQIEHSGTIGRAL